nr:hypothetical protein [Actinoplanes globisporus]
MTSTEWDIYVVAEVREWIDGSSLANLKELRPGTVRNNFIPYLCTGVFIFGYTQSVVQAGVQAISRSPSGWASPRAACHRSSRARFPGRT